MKKQELLNKLSFLCLIMIFLSAQNPSSDIKASDKHLIFPIPQKIELSTGFFIPDEQMSILIPKNSTENDIFLARFLIRELSDRYGIAVKMQEMQNLPVSGRYVLMGRYDNPLVSSWLKANGMTISEKNPGSEGYLLDISPERIIIAGSDNAGAFYGLQSLRQLIDSGKGKTVKALKVTDWPEFPFRGIRLYVPGPENIAFFKRFLRDFMSLYKYNKVIIEVNCMRLDRHPEVNAGWIEFAKYMQYSRSNSTAGLRGEEKNSSHFDAGDGYIIEKNEIRDIVNHANENFIEVIPEIPSLSHGYYLLTRHPELAEYPGDNWPDTYCPSNPDSYKLMFDVYDEYIEVMNPKMIHIGHDEWWGAPLGVCPLCKDKDPSELFAQDVKKIYDYLNSKGIKLAMWGDYLLESVREKGTQNRTTSTGIKYQTPGAVRPEVVKSTIPKDILIFNWFWRNPERDIEINNFGFKQIYGNFLPHISNWEERTKKINLQGGAPSSWAATNEFNFGKDLILDFLGCSNFQWSPHILNPQELIEVVNEQIPYLRSKLNISWIPSKDGDPIDFIDISSLFNLTKETPVFNQNLSSLKSGKVGNNEKIFDLVSPDSPNGKCAIGVGTKGEGENTLPVKVEGIPINEDVSSLIFLHACALPSANQTAYFNIPNFFDTSDLLGWYEIVYEDAYKITVPIQYGVNILEYKSGRESNKGRTRWVRNTYCYNADPVVCSSDSSPITFYAFEWVNPRFGKKIKEVNLCGTIDYQATKTNFFMPEYAPLKSNAIILTALSKVKKREFYTPINEPYK